MLQRVFNGRKVLITGHTGFKGSWLSIWLLKLGARVTGFSDRIPTEPSLFETSRLHERLDHRIGDVRDLPALASLVKETKPDFVFHLAAQPIVSIAYEAPIQTITTNIVGTANVLEALRLADQACVAVIITSDKCYENAEWPWGYRESDALGGKDIYSSSKGAAELVCHAYFHSFFKSRDSRVRIATARAGNVIGGGDWAKNRIVVDCIRNWSRNQPVDIRNPGSTRPWQHVLEPLSGYLTLSAALAESDQFTGESFNFGPRADQDRTVIELITDLSKYWEFAQRNQAYKIINVEKFPEAVLLKLNIDKARFHLGWEPNLSYEECVELVGQWYCDFYRRSAKSLKLTLDQIDLYEDKAQQRNLVWTRQEKWTQ